MVLAILLALLLFWSSAISSKESAEIVLLDRHRLVCTSEPLDWTVCKWSNQLGDEVTCRKTPRNANQRTGCEVSEDGVCTLDVPGLRTPENDSWRCELISADGLVIFENENQDHQAVISITQNVFTIKEEDAIITVECFVTDANPRPNVTLIDEDKNLIEMASFEESFNGTFYNVNSTFVIHLQEYELKNDKSIYFDLTVSQENFSDQIEAIEVKFKKNGSKYKWIGGTVSVFSALVVVFSIICCQRKKCMCFKSKKICENRVPVSQPVT